MTQLNHAQYEALERCVRTGRRIAVYRRGTEFIIIPIALETVRGREAILARNPTTGDDLTLYLDELEAVETVS
jgi:hypothetical protein